MILMSAEADLRGALAKYAHGDARLCARHATRRILDVKYSPTRTVKQNNVLAIHKSKRGRWGGGAFRDLRIK